MWRLVLLLPILLASCAQAPPIKSVHKSTYKSEFSNRLDIAVNYHRTADSAIVVVDVSNPRGSTLRLWMVQISETDGQRIEASRRFYVGDKKKHQEIFKVPLPQEGVTETFFVGVFDAEGKLVTKSEPITNSIGGT